MSMKIAVSYDITPCCLLDTDHHFRGLAVHVVREDHPDDGGSDLP
jgi:hypothetical protein